MKRYIGFLAIVLVAVLFLFGTAAYADIQLAKGMDATVELVTGSTVTFNVKCEDLAGDGFENYLIDLQYDDEILGNPRIVDSSYPEGWTLYKGLFGKGRVTYFAADETVQNPSDEDLDIIIEFTVIGVSSKNKPFETSVIVSGAATEDGTYVNKTKTDSIEMILKGGVPLGTVFTEKGQGSYTVTGKNTVAFTKADKKAGSITIPATIKKGDITFKVTEIGKKAFSKNKKIKNVMIGKNVKTIGEQAFASATKLTTVKGNAALVTIGEGAFKGCIALKSFDFGKNLKTVGASAFENCSKLASASLYDKVATIGAKAFANCKGLKKLEIRSANLDDVSNVGKEAFSNTPKKMKVKIYIRDASVYKAVKKTLIERGINKKAGFERIK